MFVFVLLCGLHFIRPGIFPSMYLFRLMCVCVCVSSSVLPLWTVDCLNIVLHSLCVCDDLPCAVEHLHLAVFLPRTMISFQSVCACVCDGCVCVCLYVFVCVCVMVVCVMVVCVMVVWLCV